MVYIFSPPPYRIMESIWTRWTSLV